MEEQENHSQIPRLLTIDEVGETLAIAKSTVYRLIRSGELRSVKIGRSHRVSITAVEEMIAKSSNDPGYRYKTQ